MSFTDFSLTTNNDPLDDSLPDYEELFNIRIELDEEGMPSNPAVFHPSQAALEAAEKEKMSKTSSVHIDTSHTPKYFNQKQNCLQRGASKAQAIFHKRQNAIEEAESCIEHASRYGFMAGTFMCALGAMPVLALSVAAASVCLQLVNHCVAQHGKNKIHYGLNALGICTNPETQALDKIKACETLKNTAAHIKHWETTRLVAGTMLKFGIGELHMLVGGVTSAIELKDGVSKKPGKTKEIVSSESLQGALSQVYYGVDLKKQQKLQHLQAS